MPERSFDDTTIARLKLAAEEVAWLTGRGYPLAVASDLVARHHGLGDEEQSALALGTCSEPQYRRRAARELEAEDVARRPLAVDVVDVVSTVEAALAGRVVLQTLDGTVRALRAGAEWAPGPETDAAIDHVLHAARELRPASIRLFVDERATHAGALRESLSARAGKAAKPKIEVLVVPDVRAAMTKERQIVTGDALLLDACGGWFNLVGRVVARLPRAPIVRLQ